MLRELKNNREEYRGTVLVRMNILLSCQSRNLILNGFDGLFSLKYGFKKSYGIFNKENVKELCSIDHIN